MTEGEQLDIALQMISILEGRIETLETQERLFQERCERLHKRIENAITLLSAPGTPHKASVRAALLSDRGDA